MRYYLLVSMRKKTSEKFLHGKSKGNACFSAELAIHVRE